MTDLTDDQITARVIEQALRELPEPSREQAHDAVCAEISHWAEIYSEWKDDPGAYAMDALTDIRRLEHATRLLRQDEAEIARLRSRADTVARLSMQGMAYHEDPDMRDALDDLWAALQQKERDDG